ncbi:T9SS type A sorting domain-containing protein [Chryseobacterium sp. WG14]|uniref:T9SS type A sorting domain-containing protein n=1 Tax=unclassified Chryseobacterium TaxID=2593645 RepID=UPI001DC2AEFB|nr:MULTISPECIES: T9SS type A sorting domain-containing protein [unclassified Chryseobacterium]MCQ9637690.1 T9SS type A sorting domain-containing protein [Chryseobacterium sp. WG23]MCQ9639998.1 T9SS type A sorting domain-containing protein [Chryseobacterium sp. WG14]CAH0282929.1 hypothetical protein SRABI04_04108 [Chryseobacterium sp. Bi04]
MTKKLFFVLLLAVQAAFAQIITKDPTFASNGVAEIPSYSISNSYQMVQNSNGEIYFTYNVDVATGVTHGFVSKLTPDGALDQSFGNNGTVKLASEPFMNQIKLQTDGKLLILGLWGNAQILRMLPNGQLDPSFGTNGISPEIYADHDDFYNSYEFILQNEKIIVHGIRRGQNPHHAIYRLNTNGSIDQTFGSNGYVTTQGNITGRTFVFIDNQSNIISFSDNISIVEKFDSNGHTMTSFGNNGVAQININGSPIGNVSTAMIDSDNRILFSTNGNHGIFRINPSGTLDTTFNYDLYTSLGLNSGPEIFSIHEKNGSYYVGGNAGNTLFNTNYFISKLNQNGSMNSTFNYYIESNFADPPYLTPPFSTISEMIVNSNTIIVKGNNYIVKYLLNNATLSATDITKTDSDIAFENPIKQSLVYHTKEKVQSIEIHDLNGKRIKNIERNGTSISEIPEGVYIAKVVFENGKTATKKLIKN